MLRHYTLADDDLEIVGTRSMMLVSTLFRTGKQRLKDFLRMCQPGICQKEQILRNCSPPIQAPKTPQQFQSQLLCQDASFTFGYDDLRRQILILSLRL